MRRLRLAACTLAALCAVGAGAAYGYLTSAGHGSGSAVVSSFQPLTVIAGSGPSQYLYPTGAATGDVTVVIRNPNPAPAHVSQLSLDTAQGTGGFSLAGCGLSFTAQGNGGSGWTVPAASGSTPGSLRLDLTGSLSMAASAPNSCQSSAHTPFTVYLKAS
jgi:hypothetical protein